MRQIRYQNIADLVRARIAAGTYPAGQLLPSEAALGAEFDASRVTIRKALEVLRSEGLVESRQGLGWIVASVPVRQPLGGLTTIEAQLRASGRTPERRIVDFGFRSSERVGGTVTPHGAATVAEHLGERVLEVVRVNLADGTPFARVTVWCREDLGADLSRSQVAEHSFYDLLPVRLGGAVQTIGAAVAGAADAALLEVPPGSAVLVVQRTTKAADGSVVLVSEHVFPAHLTQFVVELPPVAIE